jgi:hypothetical protein
VTGISGAGLSRHQFILAEEDFHQFVITGVGFHQMLRVRAAVV